MGSSTDLSGFTHVFRADIKRQNVKKRAYKRTRFPSSCVSCRTRKAKCDKAHPACGPCTKRGERDACKYMPASALAPNTNASASEKRSTSGDSSSHPPRQQVALRLQQLEELVNGLVGTNRGGRTGAPATGPGATYNDVEADTTPAPSSTASSQKASGGGSSPGHSPQASQTIGHLSQQGEFVGATHWEAVLESIHDLQVYLEDAGSDSSSEGSLPDIPPADQPDILFGPVENLTLGDVFEALPPRHEADRLFSCYFRSKFGPAPFLHVPSFRRQYEQFWTDPGSTSFLWLSILFSTLASATVAIESVTETPSPRRYRYMLFAQKCLLAGEYLKAKPYAVEALILCALGRMSERTGPDPYLWSIVGVACRLAQRMGYHRDPDALTTGRSAKITPFEGEMRRRTWFSVEAFDLMYSLQLGMPTIIHEGECDVQPPGNLLDEDFDVDTKVLPPSRPEREATPILFFRHKSRLIRLLRRLGRHALCTSQTEYSATLALDAELRAVHDLVPPAFRYFPLRHADLSAVGEQVLQQTTLEMMHLKALCILHRPFLTFEKENPKYALSRQSCREAAFKIMEINSDIVGALRSGSRLFSDKHLLTSVTLHDVLLGAMILCLDLNESDLEPSDRAQKLAVLRVAYDSWSKMSSSSRQAQHATNVLGAMLKKTSLLRTSASVRSASEKPPELIDAGLHGTEDRGRDGLLNSSGSEAPADPKEAGIPLREGNSPPSTILPMLPGARGQLNDGTGCGFSATGSFDFTGWDSEAPIGDFYPEYMDTDTVPLEKSIGDPNNPDWGLIDSYLLNHPGAISSPARALVPRPDTYHPYQTEEPRPRLSGNLRLNMYEVL